MENIANFTELDQRIGSLGTSIYLEGGVTKLDGKQGNFIWITTNFGSKGDNYSKVFYTPTKNPEYPDDPTWVSVPIGQWARTEVLNKYQFIGRRSDVADNYGAIRARDVIYEFNKILAANDDITKEELQSLSTYMLNGYLDAFSPNSNDYKLSKFTPIGDLLFEANIYLEKLNGRAIEFLSGATGFTTPFWGGVTLVIRTHLTTFFGQSFVPQVEFFKADYNLDIQPRNFPSNVWFELTPTISNISINTYSIINPGNTLETIVVTPHVDIKRDATWGFILRLRIDCSQDANVASESRTVGFSVGIYSKKLYNQPYIFIPTAAYTPYTVTAKPTQLIPNYLVVPQLEQYQKLPNEIITGFTLGEIEDGELIVDSGSYRFNGVIYNITTETTLSLPEQDEDLNRFVLPYIDTEDNEVKLVEGELNETPAKPSVPENGIALEFIFIPKVGEVIEIPEPPTYNPGEVLWSDTNGNPASSNKFKYDNSRGIVNIGNYPEATPGMGSILFKLFLAGGMGIQGNIAMHPHPSASNAENILELSGGRVALIGNYNGFIWRVGNNNTSTPDTSKGHKLRNNGITYIETSSYGIPSEAPTSFGHRTKIFYEFYLPDIEDITEDDIVEILVRLSSGKVKKMSLVDIPVSPAQQEALDSKADLVNGVVPSIQLPSYVDDVIEVDTIEDLLDDEVITPESGKIYIVKTAGEFDESPFPANSQFRWSGSVFLKLVASPGTTDNVPEGTVNKYISSAQATKLANIATEATKNDTDTNLKNRDNHTGTQTASTISDFVETVKTVLSAGVPKLDVTAPAVPGREELIKAMVSNALSRFDVFNSTMNSTQFAPSFQGTQLDTDTLGALYITGQTTSALDTVDNETPLMLFTSRRVSGDPLNGAYSAIVNRPLFGFRNYNNTYLLVYPDGRLDFITSPTVPTATTGDSSKKVATTEFVSTAVESKQNKVITPVAEKTGSFTLHNTNDLATVVPVNIATSHNITCDNTLTVGFNTTIYMKGAGQATFVAGSGVTLVSLGNMFKSAGQGAMINVYVPETNVVVISGGLTVV